MIRRLLAAHAVVACLGLAACVPSPAVAREPDVRQASFDSAGVPIHYLVTGRDDGEPIVLIHGFAASIQPQWGQVIPELGKDFKLIALDCRGHGGSGKPHEAAKYGIEMVNDVVRLLDHLKIEKAHLVGYSMGASIALGCAIHHPERVSTLTVGGSSGMNRDQKDLIATVADSLEQGKGLEPLIMALAPKDRPPPTPEFIKFIDTLVLATNDPQALAAVARSAVSSDELLPTDDQVRKTRVPLLALIGADDPLKVGVERLKELRPDAKVVVIDDSDHMTAFNRPEFVTALKQFLAEHREQPKK